MDDNGDILKSQNFEIRQEECDKYGSQNLLKNGEFEDLTSWAVDYDFEPWRKEELSEGLVGAGLKIFSPRNVVNISQSFGINRPAATQFQFSAFIRAEGTNSFTVSATIDNQEKI